MVIISHENHADVTETLTSGSQHLDHLFIIDNDYFDQTVD